jgi:hypothetical protein
MPGRVIEYNEDFVAARDQAIKMLEKERYGNIALKPFEPFIGFLPSNIKSKLQDKYGIDVHRATKLSIWLEYLAIVVLGSFCVVALFTVAFSPFYLFAGLFTLLLDAIIRYDKIQSDDEPPYGFFEWLFRIKLK